MLARAPHPASTRALADGLVLRPATPVDREQIVQLSTDAHGPRHVWGVHYLMDGPTATIDDWVVVADGDTVVATSVGLMTTFELEGVAIPVGQVEYVATLPEHRNRGHVRAIFGALEARARADGALLHLVEGIPYFYRALGYGYGLGYPTLYEPRPGEPWQGVADITVTTATADDLPAVRRLHERGRARADLVRPWPDHDWVHLLTNLQASGDRLLVARRGADVVGCGTLVYYDDFGFDLCDATADDTEAADALLGAAQAAAGDERVVAEDHPGDPFGVRLRDAAEAMRWFNARYIKVPDHHALLEAIRPLLDRRLAASRLSSAHGMVPLSSFRSTVEIHYERGRIIELRTAPGLQDPLEEGGAGVPPDWFGALVLGRFDPLELEERVDDVLFGDHRDVIEVLFPQLRAAVDWMV
jgi:predicted N-acetyltransferase YhbS